MKCKAVIREEKNRKESRTKAIRKTNVNSFLATRLVKSNNSIVVQTVSLIHDQFNRKYMHHVLYTIYYVYRNKI